MNLFINPAIFLIIAISLINFYIFEKFLFLKNTEVKNYQNIKNLDILENLKKYAIYIVSFFFMSFIVFNVKNHIRPSIATNINMLILGLNFFFFMKVKNKKLKIDFNILEDSLKINSLKKKEIIDKIIFDFFFITFNPLVLIFNFSVAFIYQDAIIKSLGNFSIIFIIIFSFLFSLLLLKINYLIKLTNETIINICFLIMFIVNTFAAFKIFNIF